MFPFFLDNLMGYTHVSATLFELLNVQIMLLKMSIY